MATGFLALIVEARSAEPIASRATASGGDEFFEKRIRPLLAANCFQCHGPEKQKSGFRLDSREAILRGGELGSDVVPGDPAASRLLRAVSYTDPDLKMPPKSKLPDEAIADLTEWVKMGAPWPAGAGAARGAAVPVEASEPTPKKRQPPDIEKGKSYWAFKPLAGVAPPTVKNAGWVRSPVDAFILAKLEERGLHPSPRADKRTLIRRVTFDLIGLPPKVDEVDAFLADDTPDAFAKVVDRLLASPHYGERWARHWLDLVLYAETDGHEYDVDKPNAWRYRDYVIRALNDDLPYNQFVMEHLAGDLMTPPRISADGQFNESILATGFYGMGEVLNSPVDSEQALADRIDRQIDVVGKAFLGLTVGCARCHDHKFDPITTKDYYALSGFMRSSLVRQADIDSPNREEQAKKFFAQISAIDAVIAELASGPLIDGLPHASVEAVGGDANKNMSANSPARPGDEVYEDFALGATHEWKTTGNAFAQVAEQNGPAWIQRLLEGPVSPAIVSDGLKSGAISDRLVGSIFSPIFVNQKRFIHIRAAGKGKIHLISDEYPGAKIGFDHRDRFAWEKLDIQMYIGKFNYLQFIDDDHASSMEIDKIVFSDDGAPPPAPKTDVASTPAAQAAGGQSGTVAQTNDLRSQNLRSQIGAKLKSATERKERLPDFRSIVFADLPPASGWRLDALMKKRREIEEQIPEPSVGLAVSDDHPIDAPVFIRGSHNNPGDVVPRRFLEVLAGTQSEPIARGSGRLELARRVLDSGRPLVARVLVNRLWQHHFGQGIVRTPDNFGVMGEPPTHPELLEYLASQFAADGWSIKKMQRMMVLSSAYQMASRASDEAAGADPRNELLHRMPVRRLEAECIRDAVLSVSGQLNETLFGSSVPPNITPYMDGRGKPDNSGPLDGAGRRSLYINIRRNFLTPLLVAFDYPPPASTIGRRGDSTVPAQALIMMNNPFIVEEAHHWAERAAKQDENDSPARVRAMYDAAFSRPPSDDELKDALGFIHEQGKLYGDENDPKVWQDFAHALFNVTEFIYVN